MSEVAGADETGRQDELGAFDGGRYVTNISFRGLAETAAKQYRQYNSFVTYFTFSCPLVADALLRA